MQRLLQAIAWYFENAKKRWKTDSECSKTLFDNCRTAALKAHSQKLSQVESLVTKKNVPSAVVYYFCAWYIFLRNRHYNILRSINCGLGFLVSFFLGFCSLAFKSSSKRHQMTTFFDKEILKFLFCDLLICMV